MSIVLLRTLKSLCAAILFWYSLIFKRGYERELEIFKHYWWIAQSHIFFGAAACVLYEQLSTAKDPAPGIISISFIFAAHAIVQYVVGYPMFNRQYQAKVDRLLIKLLQITAGFIGLFYGDEDQTKREHPEEHGTSNNTQPNDSYRTSEHFVSRHPGEIKIILRAFELPTSTTDFQVVKNRYRSLIMQHHPDRGGDTQITTRLINDYKILENYFKEVQAS